MSGLESEIRNLRADILKLKADVGRIGATLSRTARAGIRDIEDELCANSDDMWADLRHGIKDLSGKMEQRPVAVALTAISVGVLLGHLWSGRRR